MNNLPGNPYTTEEALYTEDSNNAAVVNATLALAYEQRTANLIAMYTDGNTGTAPGVNYKDLLEAITGRLDLP